MDIDFHGPAFVIAIVAICTAAWIINNWIRAKHGYPISDDWGRNVSREKTGEAAALAAENAELRGLVTKLEDRLAVLERIATDQPNRLSAEIDRLR